MEDIWKKFEESMENIEKTFDKTFGNFKKTSENSSININGNNYSGRSVVIKNGKVIIDGKEVNTGDSKEISITINGDLERLNVDYCKDINISGNVKEVNSTSGNINCGNVLGDINSTSGDIDCENIKGGVSTVSGNVSASEIKGSVDTLSGNIKYKK